MAERPQAKLTEKSAIVRKLGGVEFITKLPLTDRLIVNAEFALELGREKAAKNCATMAFLRMEKKLEPEQLAQFALKYDLKETFPRVIQIARESDRYLNFRLDGVESEKHPGPRKGAIASLLKGQISEGNTGLARILAAEFGVSRGELGKIGRRVCRSKIRARDYEGAESLASTLKLRQERQRSRVSSVIACIRAERFEEAEKKSEKWGLGRKLLKQAALEVFDGLMKKGEFLPAAAVARHFRLFNEMKKAVLSEYNRLKSEKGYRAAARLAKEYGMVAQMQAAGGMAVRIEEKRSLKVAASLAREFESGKPVVAFEKARFAGLGEQVAEFAWKFFYNALSIGDYSKAWIFAGKVGLTEAQKMLKELEKIVGPRI